MGLGGGKSAEIYMFDRPNLFSKFSHAAITKECAVCAAFYANPPKALLSFMWDAGKTPTESFADWMTMVVLP